MIVSLILFVQLQFVYIIISTKEQNLIHYSGVALTSKLLNIILHRLFPGINYRAILYFTHGCLSNSSLFAIVVLTFSFYDDSN